MMSREIKSMNLANTLYINEKNLIIGKNFNDLFGNNASLYLEGD